MFYLPKNIHCVGIHRYNIQINKIMCTLRKMVNIIHVVSTKVNNKWVMLIILIIFDLNKSHVTILPDICIVAVVKYLHNLFKRFELSMDSSCVNLNVDGVL